MTPDDIHDTLIANYSPPIVNPAVLENAVNKLLELYPDDPALGSPFNTGNETFGLPSGFKRLSAIVEFLRSLHTLYYIIDTKFFFFLFSGNQKGDLDFQSQRRSWIQAASRYGVKTFGYLFTQPQPTNDPAIGGSSSFNFFFCMLTYMCL